MHEHKHSRSKLVDVDEFYVCGGFFLDSGELGTLRDSHMTDEEKRDYVEWLAQEVPALQALKDEAATERETLAIRAGKRQLDVFQKLLRILGLQS